MRPEFRPFFISSCLYDLKFEIGRSRSRCDIVVGFKAFLYEEVDTRRPSTVRA